MSELFTELSDQQQELVAGGAITTLNLNATSFYSDTEVLGSNGVAASGPGGSAAAGNIAGANQEIFTNAFSLQAGTVD
ncbi:CTB family bacteriocin [Acaryochloris sp. IP29b_bin.148]|uniref:CTB family bacteriocin n=1 Tax=Acaryochloris sp. IP29b_bin.148 TaxID=2969218 RepID=UPI002626AAA5|nr:CTB family bacteriocin [Acaryochloris sp. IP29b_bin.148]